jgi:hypothetical protein
MPIWSCFRWGLPYRSVTRLAVRSYRTVSPLPRTREGRSAVYSLLHFPSAHAAQPLTGTLPCEARTFLPYLSHEDLRSSDHPAHFAAAILANLASQCSGILQLFESCRLLQQLGMTFHMRRVMRNTVDRTIQLALRHLKMPHTLSTQRRIDLIDLCPHINRLIGTDRLTHVTVDAFCGDFQCHSAAYQPPWACLVANASTTQGGTNLVTSPLRRAISRTNVDEINDRCSEGVKNTVSNPLSSWRFILAS